MSAQLRFCRPRDLLVLFSVGWLCFSLTPAWAAAVGSMTTASRTQCVAPCGVYFDAIDEPDWTSGVIQPRGFTSQPSIPGVRLTRVEHGTPVAALPLRYIGAQRTLSFNGGSAVSVGSGGNLRLASSQGSIHVWVNPSLLPAADLETAVSVTNGGVNADWNSFHYEWDFGECADNEAVGCPAWSAGAKKSDGSSFSKDQAFGWTAAHVYETPGTYTVRLKVIDDVGGTAEYEQTIQVVGAPPGGWKTYCVSSVGNFGDPACAGATTITSGDLKAAMDQITLQPGTKVLFRRGDSFTINAPFNAGHTDHFYLGAYGPSSQPRPKFSSYVRTSAGWEQLLLLEGIGNMTVADLWIDGRWPDNLPGGAIYLNNDHKLALRVKIERVKNGIGIGAEAANTIVQDSEISISYVSGNEGDGYCSFVQGKKNALLGYQAVTEGRRNPLRFYVKKPIFDHSTVVGDEYFAVRLMGAANPPGSGRWVRAGFNHLVDAAFSITCDGDCLEQHVRIEGNTEEISNRAAINFAEIRNGDDVAIVNNRLVSSSLSSEFLVLVQGYNGNPFQHHRVKAFNNTMHTTSPDWVRGFSAAAISFYDQGSSFQIANNIMSAPSTTDAGSTDFLRIAAAPHPFLESDRNIFYAPKIGGKFGRIGNANKSLTEFRAAGLDLDSSTNDPLFLSPGIGDLRLRDNSPAINNGAFIVTPYVRIDADGRYRDAIPDLGALEYRSGSSGPLVTFIITASAGQGGTITPSGSVTVYRGQTKTFSIRPNSGNDIASLVVDGISQPLSTTHSFVNVQANHSINVSFLSSTGDPLPNDPPADPPPGDNPPGDTPPGDDPPPSTTLPSPAETRFGKFDPVLRMNSSGDPKMSVVFDQKEGGQAELAVYDRNGQLVRSLVNRTLPASRHTVLWDGRNDSGEKLSAGSYVLVLKANEETIKKKVVVIK